MGLRSKCLYTIWGVKTALHLLLLAMALPAAVQAQGSINGLVRDSLKQPVVDVEVTVVSTDRRVRTDSAGRFTIASLDAGTYNLRARRIGYFPAEIRVKLAANSAKSVDIELERRPILLDTVNVTASCARFDFAGFACRRRGMGNSGHAYFFDVDAIDSVQPRFPIDMIRAVPGYRVVAVRNGLGLQSLTDWKCAVVVLANGKRPSRQNPLPIKRAVGEGGCVGERVFCS